MSMGSDNGMTSIRWEQYIETIDQIQQEKGYAKVKDVQLGLPAAADYMTAAKRFPGTILGAVSAYMAGQGFLKAGDLQKSLPNCKITWK